MSRLHFPTGLRRAILRHFGKKINVPRILIEISMMASPFISEVMYFLSVQSTYSALSIIHHAIGVILFLQNLCFFTHLITYQEDRRKLLQSINKMDKIVVIESTSFDLILVFILINFTVNSVLRYSFHEAWNDALTTHFIQILLIVFLYSTLNVFVPFLAIMVTLKRSLKGLNEKLGRRDVDVVLLDKMYEEVTRSLKTASRIFGPSLLLLHLSIFLYVVALCVWFCKYGVIGISLVVYLADMALPMLVICSMSNTSREVKDEIREASLKVFERILSCSEEIRDDLILLNEALVSRRIQMTAAGFFEIDNAIMVSFIGSIWYYVVVFVQLK